MRPDPAKKAAGWAACLALFAILSAGRYDWSPVAHDFSVRGYAPYLFLAALFFPALYYVLADLGIGRVWRRAGCACLGVIYSFPTHWLGLDRYYNFKQGRTYWDWREAGLPVPEPDWFWGALHRLPDIPHEFSFFFLFLITGFLAIRLWQKSHPAAAHLPWARALPFVVFAMILLQTWLHLSLRSPYTYVPHYEQPAQNHYWYHDYLFKGAQGAVNLDYPVFRHAELVFLGDAESLDVLPGRLFPMFLSSPWSAYINPYYVWIVFNAIAWSLACVAIHYLALNEFGPRCALFSTLFMASAQGVILYVAQPKIYTFGITGVALLLALHQRLFEPKRFRPMGAVLFAAVCALYMLSYESQPWLVALALIAWLRGFNLRWTLFGLGLAFILNRSFFLLLGHLPQLVLTPAMIPVGDPWPKIKNMLLGFHGIRLFFQSIRTLHDFCRVMTHAFNFCLVPALGGLLLVRLTTRRYLALLAMVLPALVTYSFFGLGSSFYTVFPRLVYQAYPLVYLLGGLCLARLSECQPSDRWPRIGLWAAILVVLLHFAWVNADVFGHPAIYYYWFNLNGAYA